MSVGGRTMSEYTQKEKRKGAVCLRRAKKFEVKANKLSASQAQKLHLAARREKHKAYSLYLCAK